MEDKDKTLYCGNLHEKVTEGLLYELFLQAGPLESVSIPKEKDGRQKNFGFVKFKHPVSVQYAVALMDGVSLHGRTLRLDVRSGSANAPNPFLEKLRQYQRLRQNDQRNSRPRQQDSRTNRSQFAPRNLAQLGEDVRNEGSRSQYVPRNSQPVQYAGYNQQYMIPQNQSAPQIVPLPQGYPPMNYGMYNPNQWNQFR